MQQSWAIRISAGIFIVLSVYLARVALEFPAGGETFPLFSAAGIVLLSLLLIVVSFSPRQRSRKIAFDLSFSRMKPLLLAVLTFVYIIAIFEIGYFVSSPVFLAVATILLGIRNYWAILVTAAILFPAMYAFFVLFLQAQLPAGIFI
ncbi:MAG: tripartite tricarboxylate transporter TctB family protein [Hyphomicrobiales bacterium]|nr:tripartite tricarboxylate transporter TctB family protein [Hyphomicrobiales bacterium]